MLRKYKAFPSVEIMIILQDTTCQTLLAYTATPIQEIVDPVFEKAGVRVLVKREDMNHPYVSGNKWWKLKYNLEEAMKKGKKTLLTFGGAYSNHIYATAVAAQELGFESIGIIRGEETLPLNTTLRFAFKCGMRIHYVSREVYRKKTEEELIKRLHKQFGDFYFIPEGGTNDLAVKGVEEFARILLEEVSFDIICLAVGTGGTMAGLINGFKGNKYVLGFPVLKGGGFLKKEIENMISSSYANWNLKHDYHFGGYGKSNQDLTGFIKQMEQQFNLPLDQVYTGKCMFGLFDLLKKGFFKKKSAVLFLHTGGLQARNF
jgi:1-aminocyclopropane-1-carboxylate deaminase